jgi:hypothetical protein
MDTLLRFGVGIGTFAALSNVTLPLLWQEQCHIAPRQARRRAPAIRSSYVDAARVSLLLLSVVRSGR